jgi:eukaryotic-like serine/threonine-protein kinase
MPHAPDLAGCALEGRYELHAMIGEGAFGRVYRGRDRRLARTVAIKVMKPWWADDPDWAERFEREAQLLARVSAPGIVQIFDVGRAEEGLYYVAEFVGGESLADRLRKGPLAPWEACEIAEQVCRGLAHAHAEGIVHGDVKPANVLISATGAVKVADFGVARLAEGSTDGGGATIVGTPRYMAPEQARGLPLTPATDVYSAGVVLYEMLAGTPPFPGSSAVELALRHLQDPPPTLPESTPGTLVNVVGRALAKHPATRYPSGDAMAESLRRARASAPALAPAPGRGPSRAAPVSPSRAARVDPTRVAPRMTPRRNLNPAARRQSIASLGLVLTLLLGMIGAAIVLAAPTRVRLPDLRGLSKAAISSRTRRDDLHPQFTSRYDQAARGIAIAQSPAPGVRVNEGSTVRVVLSQGPPPVEVPSLLGEDSTNARAILASLGLTASLTAVPAPGVTPGVITRQSPPAGTYVARRSGVALSSAETPQWRPLTSFAGNGQARSVAFRVRGTQWRVVYRMDYVGTCTWIIFCSGPSAQVIRLNTGSVATEFGLGDGGSQARVLPSAPGLYQIRIAPGSDAARWSMEVQDYY